MTNEQIIKQTLQFLGIREEAHTAAFWKTQGCHIIRGQHAAASCLLWKPKKKQAAPEDADGEAMPEEYIRVKSHLFLQSQVAQDRKEDQLRESILTYHVEMDGEKKSRLVLASVCPYRQQKAGDPVSAAKLFDEIFRLRKQAEEHLCMIACDAQMHPLAGFEVSHGGIACCPAYIREIYSRALLANAYTILICHNHPSGYPAPSEEDRLFTMRTQESGELIGIPLADSLIVGEGDSYFSFREAGALAKKDNG